jgi:hypothetical protein
LGDARIAVFARHQADGERTLIEVVDFGARPAEDQRSGLDFVLVERGAQACGHSGIERAYAHLAGEETEAVNLADGGFGMSAGGDDEAELQGGRL